MRKGLAVLGVDVGGTKTLCLLVDSAFKIIDKHKFATAPEEGRKEFIRELLASLYALAKVARRKDLKLIGAGVAWAGKVDQGRGIVETAPNLLALEKLSVRRLFEEKLSLPVCLGNDVQLALYAEHRLGAARGCQNVLGVFFGTGVGGAAIIGGALYRGANGMAGQLGSLLTHQGADSDSMESHSILDRMVSKGAIAGAALNMAAKQWARHLFEEAGTDLANVSWGALRRSIRKGDVRIKTLLRGRLHMAGTALSNVVNFMNPEMLVVGGGLAEEMPDLVRAELEKSLRSCLMPEVSRALKVKLARFKNKAGALGAACLAFEKFQS